MKKKSWLAVLLCVLLVLSGLSLIACGDKDDSDAGDGGNYTQGLKFALNADGNSYAVRGLGDATGTTIVIPPTYNGKPVTAIEESAFSGCSSLTSIEIPQQVTSIGECAFSGCSSLTSIEIPQQVTSIGENPFYGCDKLARITVDGDNQNYSSQDGILYDKAKTVIVHVPQAISVAVTIPNTITSIGRGVFGGRKNLPSIEIPSSVTSIGAVAFSGCGSLTSITIPQQVTSIGEQAFTGCANLESITVESGNANYAGAGNCLLETASKTLILGCKTSVIPIDGSVTKIGDVAFSKCDQLTSISIPASVTNIGKGAFSGCSGLNNISLAESSQSRIIGNYAFSGCSALTSITLPSNVTSIGEYAFQGCGGLVGITIPSSVKYIGKGAFYACNELSNITYGDTKAQWTLIVKGEYWNGNTGNYTVTCTNGTISKSES